MLRINVVGTPGFVIDGRRADCVEETKGNFLVRCSFDDGVEIDCDDDELDDDDVNGRCIGVEPLLFFPGTAVAVVVVVVVVVAGSFKRSIVFEDVGDTDAAGTGRGGDDVLMSEGDGVRAVWFVNSFD